MIATKIEDLPTVYDAKDTEESIYKFWEDGEYFKADANSQKPPYSIVIPPPNVTGVLHMGHALDETLQDILVLTMLVWLLKMLLKDNWQKKV